jgi:hypothetical protein
MSAPHNHHTGDIVSASIGAIITIMAKLFAILNGVFLEQLIQASILAAVGAAIGFGTNRVLGSFFKKKKEDGN